MNKLAEDNEIVNIDISNYENKTVEGKKETTEPKEPKEKKAWVKPDSLESEYSDTIKSNPDIKKLSSESNAVLFKWSKNHWSLLTELDGMTNAYNWLYKNYRHSASKRMAFSCHETTKLVASELPKETNDIIIPLKNVWLKLVNNEYKIIDPTSSMNVRFVIDTNLNCKVGSKTYKPTATPEKSKFAKYLNSTLPNKEIQNLVQEYCGYTLTNDVGLQKALIMEGEGSNGKSILLSIMKNLHQKWGAIDLDDTSRFSLTPLMDSSLVVVAEAPKRKIRENMLKMAISGDPMNIEYKGKDVKGYCPKAKWLISCNAFPHIEDKSNGVLRRLIIVPFEATFEGANKTKDLDKQLINEELDIIVNWCLEGLQRLLKRGDFEIPEALQKVKQEKQEEFDPVRKFARDYGLALTEETDLTPKQDIYEQYLEFSENQGSTPCVQAEFWKRIKRVVPNFVEIRKVIAGRGKIQHRVVNLATGIYEPTDPEPSKPVKSDEQPKADVCPTPTITEPTEEAKQLVHAYRVEVLTQKADALLNAPEPTESKVWFINGNRYTFKPKYLKDLSEAVATIPFDPSNPLCVIYAIEQKIKAKTATTEEKEHLAKLELIQKEQAKLTTSQEQE